MTPCVLVELACRLQHTSSDTYGANDWQIHDSSPLFDITAGSFAAVVTWNFAAVTGGLMFVHATFSPNHQKPFKRTMLRPPSAGTASPPLGESKTGFLPSSLPSRLPQCLPTPPHSDRLRYCCCQHCRWCCRSWGLAWGLNWHQRPLVSLSVMAATALCRPAVPSAWGCGTGVH